MNPHDKNYLPPKADYMFARLFATILFGVCMFVVGYMSAEIRFKANPPVCKPVVKAQAQMPRTKAEMARFVRQFHNQDAGFIK